MAPRVRTDRNERIAGELTYLVPAHGELTAEAAHIDIVSTTKAGHDLARVILGQRHKPTMDRLISASLRGGAPARNAPQVAVDLQLDHIDGP